MRLFRGSDDGATAITIAITMVVLMGFTALALDGGVVYNERRSTHNAADHSALAAAWAACNGDDPQAAGVEAAEQNGYIATDVTIVNEGGDRYRATVTAVEDTTFARLIGTDQVTVVSEAVADCTVFDSLGGFALFAGGSQNSCGNSLETPGAGLIVNGGAHSNGSIASPGPPIGTKQYNGPVTYGPGGGVSGPDGQWSTDPELSTDWLNGEDPIYPVPDYWIIENYDSDASTTPGTPAYEAAQAGAYTAYDTDQNLPGGSLSSGVYFVDGDVQLSGNSYFLDQVTIVATGDIHISGAFITGATPYFSDGLLFFSDFGSPGCDDVAIHYSNASGTWNGVWYAPNGQIRINSALGFTSNGSLIGYTINLAGANRTITYDETLGGGPFWTVELTE